MFVDMYANVHIMYCFIFLISIVKNNHAHAMSFGVYFVDCLGVVTQIMRRMEWDC